jgi:hypothetical protein
MTLDNTKLFARAIADINNEQQDIKQNISAEDNDSLLQLGFSELLAVSGTFTATKYNYASNAFIIDHPVNSELDSAVLVLDGGYAGISTDLTQSLKLDTSVNPIAGVVNDLSYNNNDGTYNINMTAYYPFNGNADDESINSNDGTVT